MRFTTIAEELAVTKFKKSIEREIEYYFEEMGFDLIEPRIFQKYDEYISSAYKQNLSKTVKVLGGDSRIFILRPDITINILGEIFSKWDGDPPLKVYYNSKTYLNGSRGKILENHQMGIEYLGDDILKGDLEILEMASTIMATLNDPFIIELGFSKYLDGFFHEINLNYDDEMELRDFISKKNKYSLRTKLGSLGIENTILDHILDMQGDMEDVIKIASRYRMNADMEEALEQLKKVKGSFKEKAINNIKLDLSMIPDLDYYDGIIFKGYCLNSPNKILSGGRYDRLTGQFGLKTAAIGFMIDMDYITRIRMKEEK